MSTVELIFWACAALVGYVYVLYPLLMAVRARCARRRRAESPIPESISIVLAVRNEERQIERRLSELTTILAARGLPGEILVVSDGSTDATVALAHRYASQGVRVLELPENVGKAAALSAACEQAIHDVIVFADVRQRWASDAIDQLLANFADPRVGAVSGELVIESSPGVLAGVGLYWRYEKWIRQQESRVHSTVGVTGAICAVRRELFRPIPAGTLLDDVYWPLQVAMQGYRIVVERAACAFDRLPERPRDEFRRKVRTLSGNFQLIARLPAALAPWRNPVWFPLVSHKLLRLLVPWALLIMLVCNLFLEGPLYRVLLSVQVFGYVLGVCCLLCTALGARSRLASAAGSFLVLNSAAWLAFWVWLCGRADQSWQKVHYVPATDPSLTAATSNRR